MVWVSHPCGEREHVQLSERQNVFAEIHCYVLLLKRQRLPTHSRNEIGMLSATQYSVELPPGRIQDCSVGVQFIKRPMSASMS